MFWIVAGRPGEGLEVSTIGTTVARRSSLADVAPAAFPSCALGESAACTAVLTKVTAASRHLAMLLKFRFLGPMVKKLVTATLVQFTVQVCGGR